MRDCNSHVRRILGKWALNGGLPVPNTLFGWYGAARQWLAGQQLAGTVGAFVHRQSELLVQDRKGLLYPKPFWLFWSSVTVQQPLFALCTAWTLTQGCRTSLPSAEQSQQDLCEARSPLPSPQIAPASSHSTTLSWSTLGHLQLLLQHRGCHPVFRTQWLTLFALARRELTLWACSRVPATTVLKNMFHVALNFI